MSTTKKELHQDQLSTNKAHVLTSHPDMPKTLIVRAKKGFFLSIYQNKWVPAHVNAQGRQIPGTSKPMYRRTIGRIMSEDGLGLVQFKEEFYQDYPDIRNYIVKRVGKGKFEFTPINAVTVQDAKQNTAVSESIDAGNNVVRPDGSIIQSADGIPFSRNPSDLLDLMKQHEDADSANILPPKYNSNPTEFIGYSLNFGSVLMLLSVLHSTGIDHSISEGLKKAHKLEGRQLTKTKNRILARVAYIAITRDHSCEHIESFYKNNYFPGLGACSKRTMQRASALMNQEFIKSSQEAFIDFYVQSRSKRLAQESFELIVDGTVINQKNHNISNVTWGRGKDGQVHSQVNMQVVSDSAPDGLPLFYMLFPGSNNDVQAFKLVLQRLALLGLTIDNSRWVADKGYGSIDNIIDVISKEQSFIFNMKKGQGSKVNKAIDAALKHNILNFKDWADYEDDSVCYVHQEEIKYDDFPVLGKRKSKKASCIVNYHVFYNRRLYNATLDKEHDKVRELLKRTKQGDELSDSDKQYLEDISDFKSSEYVVGRPYKKIEIDNSKINEKIQYAGFMVLATDDLSLTSNEVKHSYDRRNIVETHIQVKKDILDGACTGAKTTEGFESKLHLLWMATVARVEMCNKLRAIKERGIKKYKDAFRSVDHVLHELSGLKVDQLKSGIVLKPFSKKSATVLDEFSIELPYSCVSYSKWSKHEGDSIDDVDDVDIASLEGVD